MHYPLAAIFSFEPSSSCFKILNDKYSLDKKISLNPIGLGARKEFQVLTEYNWSPLNSFLERNYTEAEVIAQSEVEVETIDHYCATHGIAKIDVLKTDTEGFDLEVLKGASEMLKKGKIKFVLTEVFFNLNYIGQNSFGDLYNYLLDADFELVRFYDFVYTPDGRASKTDALFKYNPKTKP
ncbi:FkbM family methyltransferase [Croceiramulus getboli]|nr:FkbM family methyltransferase [Flavobacteriaceae bacterium YJPT1-3]